MGIARQWERAGSIRLALLGALVLTILVCATPAHAATQPPKVLIFTGTTGTTDASVPAAVTAIKELGDQNGFAADSTADPAGISADNLAGYRAVVFVHSSGDVLNSAEESALQDYIQAGNGFVGIGGAASLESGSFFDGLIGARPTGAPGTATAGLVEVGDRVHPATKGLSLEWSRSDRWYPGWATNPTGSVHTVARFRPGAAPGDGTAPAIDRPISWCRDYQGGRSFFTGMGWTSASYSEAAFRSHLLGAIQWASGMVRAGCKATINANYTSTRITQVSSANLNFGGESHGVTIAPNGWVIYIGRADCGTNEERGKVTPSGQPTDRITDFSQPLVGIGCGTIHVWDPSAYEGVTNSGVTRAATLAVFGDCGTSGERTEQANHKCEHGLVGITVAPDFMQTGHIYVMYHPSFVKDTMPPGLPDGDRRRVTKMGVVRVSRFTMDLATKKVDLSSEVRIFENERQIYSCCHEGGGMGFDSEGNLYWTAGDSNSSGSTGGYSGNYQPNVCATGDPNQASNTHCGDNPIAYNDARRTAGSTHDYNGKMLRVKPIASIPDGTQPKIGIGSTYTIPGATSPNGPNLFDGTEGGGGLTYPEIYAMGLRNPARLSIDRKTDIPYTGWVGPDASSPSSTQGPSTYETASQIAQAGNYGWPYCMGNGQAFRDRVADGSLRAANAPGYVSGGPAGPLGTEGWYDCDHLVNDSIRNTGMTVLPQTTGTGMNAGRARHTNVWYSRGNPSSANGCPDFPRPNGPGTAPDYGATPTQLCPYATASGMTVMNGPVYRYENNTGGDAAFPDGCRWPAYWDGKWFVTDFSGAQSIRHFLTLDPKTAAQGTPPVYADSMKSILTGPGASYSYMDGKFGPDGAFYMQVYGGSYFRLSSAAGLYKVCYTGGGPTPTPRLVHEPGPQRLQVQFRGTRAGGIAYEWDFGDGETSADADPIHAYPSIGTYEAHLKVTYADGETASLTSQVDVTEVGDVSLEVPHADGVVPFGTRVPYEVTVVDPENGSSDENPDVCDRVTVRSEIIHASDSHPGGDARHGCKGWIEIDDDPQHGATEKTLVRLTALYYNDSDAVVLQPSHWQAEHFDDNSGVEVVSDANAEGGRRTGALNEGDWMAYGPYDLSRIDTFMVRASNRGLLPYTVELRSDSPTGPLVGSVQVPFNIDGSLATTTPAPVSDPGGTHPLFAVITGAPAFPAGAPSIDLGGVDWIEFQGDGVADMRPPVSTLELDPADPDGNSDWYRSPVTVTLAAGDGTGSGVARTEYRIDGGDWSAYDGPFTVTGGGRHTLDYRSVDFVENVEAAKSATIKVDRSAPVSTDTVEPGSGDNQVKVTFDADDGPDGSGVERTEYRIDGGAWQTYSQRDEVVLDTTSMDALNASLAHWRQAPSGKFDPMQDQSGPFIRANGGLGMLWYAAKAYGDVRISLEARDSRGGAAGDRANSGVFVRFPDPDEAVARPAADRYPCQTGSAQTSPAWVAIYCGHELQIYDGTTGEVQKTGSVYNFKPLPIEKANPTPKGSWDRYEYVVTGAGDWTVKIYRNDQLLNEFKNSPGQSSSRSGDPPTDDRQFASGYIGLQNHSTTDAIDFRNVRVEELHKADPAPVVVDNPGEHTVEYRSIDVAGNVEETKTVSFVGLPETYQVTVRDNFFDPGQVAAKTGDIVRWDFSQANSPHDLWVVVDGEHRQVSDGIVFPGTPPLSPVQFKFDKPGTYPFYCSIHGYVDSGMSGTITVTDAPT